MSLRLRISPFCLLLQHLFIVLNILYVTLGVNGKTSKFFLGDRKPCWRVPLYEWRRKETRQQAVDNINCIEWFGATWSSLPNCSYTWPKLCLSLLASVVELLSFEIAKCSSQNGFNFDFTPRCRIFSKGSNTPLYFWEIC